MSSIFETLFGGVDDSAQQAQLAQNQAAIDLIARNAAQARRDALSLFPAADAARNLGMQGAFELLAGSAIPQQVALTGAGNLGAQQTLLAGMPQVNAAILGTPLDPNALQAMDFRPQAVGFEPFAFRDLLGGFQAPNVPGTIAGSAGNVSFVPNAPAPVAGRPATLVPPPRLTERPFNPSGGGGNN